MRKHEVEDNSENRFATAFERIAGALELVAQKMAWPYMFTAGAAPQPYVPYQPIQPAIYSSPNTNGTAVPTNVGSFKVDVDVNGNGSAFQDLTEGRPMRVGTGG